MRPKIPFAKYLFTPKNIAKFVLIGSVLYYGPQVITSCTEQYFPSAETANANTDNLNGMPEQPSQCFYKIQTAGGALAVVNTTLLVEGMWVPAVRVFTPDPQNPFYFDAKQLNYYNTGDCPVPGNKLTDVTMPIAPGHNFSNTYFPDNTCGLVLKFFQLSDGHVYSFEAVDYKGTPVFNDGLLGTGVSSDICN